MSSPSATIAFTIFLNLSLNGFFTSKAWTSSLKVRGPGARFSMKSCIFFLISSKNLPSLVVCYCDRFPDGRDVIGDLHMLRVALIGLKVGKGVEPYGKRYVKRPLGTEHIHADLYRPYYRHPALEPPQGLGRLFNRLRRPVLELEKNHMRNQRNSPLFIILENG